MIAKIVVGVDGSAASDRACDWAANLSRSLGAEVVAVGVADVAPYFHTVTPEAPLLAPSPSEIEQIVGEGLSGEWTRPLRDSGVRFRTVVATGDPAHELVEVARREGADLLVVGTSSRGQLSELVLGSVAHTLTHHSHLPVVVIPALEGDATEAAEEQIVAGRSARAASEPLA